MNRFILFIFLSLIAEIVGTVCGFGSSVLFVPIAGFFLDFKSVLGVTAVFHLSSNLSKIGLFRKSIDKRIFLQVGIPSILFVLIGAWLSRYVNDIVLNILLASFLIVFSLFNMLFKYFRISGGHCRYGRRRTRSNTADFWFRKKCFHSYLGTYRLCSRFFSYSCIFFQRIRS